MRNKRRGNHVLGQSQTERLDHAASAFCVRIHLPSLDVSLIMTEPIVSLLVTLMVLWTCRWGMVMTRSQSSSFISSVNSAITDSRSHSQRKWNHQEEIVTYAPSSRSISNCLPRQRAPLTTGISRRPMSLLGTTPFASRCVSPRWCIVNIPYI